MICARFDCTNELPMRATEWNDEYCSTECCKRDHGVKLYHPAPNKSGQQDNGYMQSPYEDLDMSAASGRLLAALSFTHTTSTEEVHQ